MRMVYWLVFILTLMSGFALASDAPSSNTIQAIFTQVRGKVQVLVPNRKKPKKAQKDLVVTQGDRIMAQEDSSAVLRLFDGSELKIEPNTEFVLSEMQKPSDQDKNFKFSLFIGKLTAVVKKLTSASSSFEIEAGGVVCGVR
ncbi:MAG TPA: FecR domain-containing protein, partial [bacterium]|nr:FecR domain-containing protein [bacterium]